MESVDLIITAGMLQTSPFNAVISDGAVAIKNGVIVETGIKKAILGRYEAKRLIERPLGLLMPGLINCHTHAAMTIFRGMADDLPLKIWLEEHIFPAESQLTPELVAIGTELACAEMIRSGTTSFVDMYLFEDAVASVVDRVGMRAWLGEGVFDFPTPAFKDGLDALKETERLLDKWHGHERIAITVDPHTPYTCREELWQKAEELADKTDTLLVTHISETDWEVAEMKRRVGKSPVAYLDSLHLLNERVLAAHCVALSRHDMELLSNRRVGVVHCPESNLKLASGVAPVSAMLRMNGRVCLGTDGAASNNDLNMFGEMRTAALLHKGVQKDPVVMSSIEVFAMATCWAADALHRKDIGRCEPGCRADLVILDMEQPHMTPCYNPLSQIVYATNGAEVSDVLVNGTLLMEKGNLLTIDEARLMSRIKTIVSDLRR
ncbi:MAG: amidohydrolase [Dissulfuribacterales bacterium]